jgi:hypothetical protein
MINQRGDATVGPLEQTADRGKILTLHGRDDHRGIGIGLIGAEQSANQLM